jgi:endonuclease/exonuclease/phosphatase family metal-dependent hydrolase
MTINKHTKKKTYKFHSNRTKSNKSNPHKNVLNILSYNISWESMSGAVKSWSLCNNNTDKSNSRHSSVCVNNISNVFDSSNTIDNTLDFITLQEATDYKKLISESSRLKNMKYEIHKSGLDTIVTFWDSKYKLKKVLKGEFEKGRPWMATLFNSISGENLCLVNVHMGHYDKENQIKNMDKMVLDIKSKLKVKEEIKNMKMRYIISGDFNYNIKEFGNSKNYFTLGNTNFYYNKKHILTCCINRRKHNDHVIDSLESPIDINIPKVNYMASDHKPILVKITQQ